jgi:hypothetical protein
MTTSEDEPVFSTLHATCFGYIIAVFARIETNMMTCAAGILDTDLASAYILMADTHYRQKRQTLTHLNATLGVNGRISEELTAILDDVHKYSRLRNWIAHSPWVKGNRPGSIKPMQLILRGETLKPLGHWHNEQSYTADDLKDELYALEDVSNRFAAFLDSSGLKAKVRAKIAAIKPLTSEEPGKPSAK